jgi:serpin B
MKRLILLVLVASLVPSACGSDVLETGGNEDAVDGVQAIQVSDRTVSTADPTLAGEAITEFGQDIFQAARNESADDNVTLSPLSIAVALAMLEPGTGEEATAQFREVFHFDDSETFHASINALEQALENRELPDYGDDNDAGELTLRITNAAYLQAGYPFESTYLEVIGSNYGPVLNEVDFMADTEDVRQEINGWVSDQTNERIPELIPEDSLKPETVLALVNALYLNASWFEPFDEASTVDERFTRLDGTGVDVPLMQGSGSTSSQGDGWVGATKSYTGGMSIQFILPDEGEFEQVADNLRSVIAAYAEQQSGGTTLHVPRFETRTSVEVSPLLQTLGLTLPYQEGNLLGVAGDPNLIVDQVIHQTWVSIDEQGTEAAAATVVLATTTSAPANAPVPVILDRPFLYRIFDHETGATLFIGQVVDPTA